MRLLIMGPPGVGKGTQSKGIAAHYAVPAISTGDIFRSNVNERTPLGLRVAEILTEGGYVPDEITDAIVADRLSQPDAANGWLLDGFPRTIVQVGFLDAMLAERDERIDGVISLTAQESLLVERMLHRAEVEGRPDDNAETIQHRMDVYNEETGPLLDHYAALGLLVEVEGVGPVDEVNDRIIAALSARQPA